MPQTALSLVRELSERLGDLVVSTPTAGGTTTLFDASLLQYFPQPLGQFNGWVYCTQASPDAQNRGFERRGQQWQPTATVLQLYPPGFPQPITSGEYEISMRFPRRRKMAALNSAIAQLGLTWYRQIVDETIITQPSTWIYYPDPLQNWSNIYRLEIQINTSETQVGYPYADAEYLNWRSRRWVDSFGKETWAIEFGILPPVNRKLRVFGEGFYPVLDNDSDLLAIAGKWEGGALEWIYDWAEFRLNDSLSNRQPTGEAERVRQQAMDRLERQKNDILASAPSHLPARIVTPGHGDAMAYPSPEDWRYLGAFRSSSFIRA
ncbi:MAG TPA: hypothetical protein VLL82_13540 [Mycobacterium sp.]|nr:hypothetical protein [Mycobacterium sp.]